MPSQDPHLLELIAEVERALGALKAYAAGAKPAAEPAVQGEHRETVKAFADEAFRARDA